jgi:hypothetical protein
MLPKYTPLCRDMRTWPRVDTEVTFEKIENILGFSLPRSAHVHSAWWSNERGTHVQARAWMDAGWQVWHVSLSEKKVYFRSIQTEEPPIARPVTYHASPRAVVEDGGAPFTRGDEIVVSKAALRGGAIRLLEDFSEAHGGSLADSIAGILNGLVLERRRQLLERFPKTGAPSPVDSAELIRQDRDAR